MAAARIYLVEDDRDVRNATRLMLQAHGYAVSDFEDAEKLLALTQGRGADAMILDIMLPGLSGIALLTVLREHEIHTPVVLVSADAARFREQGMRAGAADILNKPYDPAQLLAALSDLAS